MIDMRNMKAIRMDKENTVVYLQGGCVVSEVGNETIKHGTMTSFVCQAMRRLEITGPILFSVRSGYGYRCGK